MKQKINYKKYTLIQSIKDTVWTEILINLSINELDIKGKSNLCFKR